MKTVFVLFLLYTFFIVSAYSQATNKPTILLQLENPGNNQGKVVVKQNEKITVLLAQHIERNKRIEEVPGYRIRIFSASANDNGKNRALDAKSKFLSKYSDISSYLKFDTPNYKVYVGDYRTKHDAYRALKLFKTDYPNAFIVNDQIKL